jgi:hypothetical protein
MEVRWVATAEPVPKVFFPVTRYPPSTRTAVLPVERTSACPGSAVAPARNTDPSTTPRSIFSARSLPVARHALAS